MTIKMKLFWIESKFIARDSHNVTQHRRLVTPWFYVKLKPLKYTFREKELLFLFTVPCRFTGWVNEDNDYRVYEFENKELIAGLDSAVKSLIA